MKPCLKLKFCLALILIICIFHPAPAEAESIYYARYQIFSENGIITKSTLEMIPADDEFRMEPFQRLKSVGAASDTGVIDVESEAIHNAIGNVLIRAGLKSIHSRRRMIYSASEDLVILNYEGMVRFPITAHPVGGKPAGGEYRVEADIQFSPMAFPTSWSSLYIEYSIKKKAAEIGTFLTRLFIR